MKNIKKILALTLCSSAILVGCNKRQKITLEVANDFCLKKYKAIIKECSQTTVDYNLSFRFDSSKEIESDIEPYAKLIVGWYSLYNKDSIGLIPKDLIKFNGDLLTIKGTLTHKNTLSEGIGGGSLFFVQSLGVRSENVGKINSYIYEYVDTCYSEYNIFVANNNNIVISGTSKMGLGELGLYPLFFPNAEDVFDDDGCYEKCTVKLPIGTEIKTSRDSNSMFRVTADSSITAKYTYF